MFFIIFLCCVLTVHQSDASVYFDVSPPAIQVDKTSYLIVNCTFTYSLPSEISHFISIIISKSVDDRNTSFHELVSINTFDARPVILEPLVNATTSGQLDNSGMSYLSLYWTYPSLKEAGLYGCTVNGIDSTGRPKDVSYTAQVTASNPNVDQLIDIVRDQQVMFIQVEKALVTIGDTVNKLVSSVEMLVSKQATIETPMDNANESNAATEKLLKLLTGEYNGKCYLLSKSQNSNFNTSQKRCEQLGGYLAEIEDANENTFIKKLINTTSPNATYVLLGGIKEYGVYEWVWEHSHRPVSFSDWAYEQVGHVSFYETRCLFMYDVQSWRWADYPCTLQAYFLCEVDL